MHQVRVLTCLPSLIAHQKFKFKSFIVRCTEQHRVRLGTEILRTRQRKATWHNIIYTYIYIKYIEHRLHLNKLKYSKPLNIQNCYTNELRAMLDIEYINKHESMHELKQFKNTCLLLIHVYKCFPLVKIYRPWTDFHLNDNTQTCTW